MLGGGLQPRIARAGRAFGGQRGSELWMTLQFNPPVISTPPAFSRRVPWRDRPPPPSQSSQFSLWSWNMPSPCPVVRPCWRRNTADSAWRRGHGLFGPKELDGLLAWVACIADAQPIESYVSLRHAGVHILGRQFLKQAGTRLNASKHGRKPAEEREGAEDCKQRAKPVRDNHEADNAGPNRGS
jgi:hypothetical protein